MSKKLPSLPKCPKNTRVDGKINMPRLNKFRSRGIIVRQSMTSKKKTKHFGQLNIEYVCMFLRMEYGTSYAAWLSDDGI